MGQNDAPVNERVFGKGSYLRPKFVQLYRCRNILLEGVTVRNSPMWHLHPVLSENVTVRGVAVEGHGPNNDGCNPESCRDVLSEDCLFDTGDDCIAVKSGRNRDFPPTVRNIEMRNVTKRKSRHALYLRGYESNPVRDIRIIDCSFDNVAELDVIEDVDGLHLENVRVNGQPHTAG